MYLIVHNVKFYEKTFSYLLSCEIVSPPEKILVFVLNRSLTDFYRYESIKCKDQTYLINLQETSNRKMKYVRSSDKLSTYI